MSYSNQNKPTEQKGQKVDDNLQSEETAKDDTGNRTIESNNGDGQSPVAGEPESDGEEGNSRNINPKGEERDNSHNENPLGEGEGKHLGSKILEGESGEGKICHENPEGEENKGKISQEKLEGKGEEENISNENPEDREGRNLVDKNSKEEGEKLREENSNNPEPCKRNPNFATEGKDKGLKGSDSSSNDNFGSIGHSKRRPSQDQETEDKWVEAAKTLKRWSRRVNPWHIIIMSLTLQAGSGLLLGSVLINWSINWMWPSTPAHNLTPNAENIYDAVVQNIHAGKIALPDKGAEELKKYLLIEQYEEAIDKLNKSYSAELERQVSSLNATYEVKLNQTTQSLQREFAANLSETLENCQANISKAKEEVLKTVDEEKEKLGQLTDQQTELDKRLNLEPQLMEIRGFMKIETFGPILMVVGLVEIVMMLCICNLCNRNWTGGARNPGAAQSQANGSTKQAREQERGAVPLISTSNTNIAVIAFRNSDEDRCEQWGKTIVESLASRSRIVTHVVNSIQDVNEIPACRAALVFVDPDEREMLIEDERHHIGQGLRRCAVQRLMDSGVEVFVVIFNDKNSETLADNQLFNRKLGQINEHKQLMELKKRKRIISIKRDVHQHQKDHLVAVLSRIFT